MRKLQSPAVGGHACVTIDVSSSPITNKCVNVNVCCTSCAMLLHAWQCHGFRVLRSNNCANCNSTCPSQHPETSHLCMQFRQKLANFAVFCARHFFDRITSYNLESMTERKWLRRILFLETVAGTACLLRACHCLASSLLICSYINPTCRICVCVCVYIYIIFGLEMHLLCASLLPRCSLLPNSVACTLCHGGHRIPVIACTCAPSIRIV